MVTISASAKEYVAQLLDNPLLHQQTAYTSPVDSTKTLEVSFATTTNFRDEGAASLATILYLGPMMCSRYLLAHVDTLARSKHVKVIFIDRPGFGKSTPAPVSERLLHVMACIPAVLSYLDVTCVSVMSASAGTVYLLNFLVAPELRAYLHPRHPYVAALVPWVHPEYSASTLWTTAGKLPASLIGSCGGLQKLVATKIMPGIGWSSMIFGSIGGLLSKPVPVTRAEEQGDEDLQAKTGLNKAHLAALDEMVVQRMFQEDTSGLGHEALTCLRKDMPESSWGIASSYPGFVTNLVKLETECMTSHVASVPVSTTTSSSSASSPEPNQEQSRLRLRVFFASSDIMIGEKGAEYFNDCFHGHEGLDKAVHYSSSVIPESDHDSVMDVRKGVIASVFDDVIALQD